MRLSKYYLPTLKEIPASTEIISHQYSIRAGLVKQTASGIYSWLPLGLLVLKNIKGIIRDEMDKSGAIEVLMPCVQPANLWQESERYNDYGKEMLRIKDRYENGMLFGPTHEEVATDLIRYMAKSYKNLPLCLYQIQWKFRDEVRPRYGVMRGREFLMKDAYSFDIDYKNALNSYNLMYKTYIKIFKRMGFTPIVVRANTGLIGGNLSHEFHIPASIGESTLYYDNKFPELLENEDVESLKSIYAVTDDMYHPKTCPIPQEQLRISKGIEVGHIFYFGNKYSKPMNAKVTTQDGKNVNIHMGSYGIGVSRLVGAIIEAFHDDKGIIWPETIAPFRIGLTNLQIKTNECVEIANKIYKALKSDKVLYDDTKGSIGAKFARMDLIGLPWQIIVGKKAVSKNLVEVKNRVTGEMEETQIEEAINRFSI
ncbi:proline--tRNA ligase [Wolbachia endosymbiont of Dirofilaria (Dirofilaria) immitis]|uniref:proline--tRNA ligase n=1 Tax=Wolbachia endosymbiont of Dirofilaria (Dirofilaria) immitis TaxID=1812115 RepID=UPI001588E1FB|nr:proline--tRNA ligase [Wolbachia endosymbiont of Dirofilaria (Dirofilaria) immitis]QKX02540.1 proline--tRNA ligase [Wolbachia endosymbiont of Dirofilaria (Dirofilaria) immitis]